MILFFNSSKGYLQVLSRPLALSQDESLIDWSITYQDAAVNQLFCITLVYLFNFIYYIGSRICGIYN